MCLKDSGLPQFPFLPRVPSSAISRRGLLTLVTHLLRWPLERWSLSPLAISRRCLSMLLAVHPAWWPQLPAFTKKARGPSRLLCPCIMQTPSIFWPQNPLAATSVGNLGEGAASGLLCAGKRHVLVCVTTSALHVNTCRVFREGGTPTPSPRQQACLFPELCGALRSSQESGME